MIKVTVPGKLFIAGEYAVVNSGSSAILMAVNRFLEITITQCDITTINSDGYIDNLQLKRNKNELIIDETSYHKNHLLQAIRISEKYLTLKGFTLVDYNIKVKSTLTSESGEKLGLGSSGAVTVGIIEAILKFYQVEYDDSLLFKLAVLAQAEISKNGSFADLAVIISGGTIRYTTFNKEYVFKYYQNHGLENVLTITWPLLEIEIIKPRIELNFVVGWTKAPAITEELVKKVTTKKSLKVYQKFLEASDQLVSKIKTALIEDDEPLFYSMISLNRRLLKSLSGGIETTKLKILIEIVERYGVAKVSGAGGGDCGIGFIKNKTNKDIIIEQWHQADIEFLDLEVYNKGENDEQKR